MREILRRHSFSIAFVALLFAFFFSRPGDDSSVARLAGFTMGTTYTLQYVALPEGASEESLQQQVTALLQRLDREIFSTYAEDSELSRLNRAPLGQPVAVSAELMEVALLAQEVSELTGGAFDVTVGPLVNLWGFGPTFNATQLPEAEVISEALERVGYRYLATDSQAVTLTRLRDIYIDLSAIAKGYAVDKVADLFDNIGIDSYFLEIGGELKIRGRKADGVAWVPALEQPLEGESRIYRLLQTDGGTMALAGSGDYRNYFELDGVRYSHEIDPVTGWPVSHNLAAAYVIDTSAARADALATALMVLGLDRGRALAEQWGLAVGLIQRQADGSFTDYFSSAFQAYLVEGETR